MRAVGRSRWLGVLVLSLCASAMAVTPAALAAQQGGLIVSQFKLKGTHGYSIEGGELREGDFPPTVAVVAQRGSLQASYEVPGELEPGLHAVFGSLGRADLSFDRRRRSVEKPEKGCTWITETGVFRGEFSFLGEGGYTAAEATSMRGQVTRLPNGFCGFGEGRENLATPDFLRATRLAARSPIAHGFVQFEALAWDIEARVEFEATTREVIGPMKISRAAIATAGEDGFSVGPGKRPAHVTVDPPAPFVGSARFQRRAGAAPTWEGSLSVSLPGAPAIALAGPGFATRLCLRSSILARCKTAQGSGSHSQAFWDARLSWSR